MSLFNILLFKALKKTKVLNGSKAIFFYHWYKIFLRCIFFLIKDKIKVRGSKFDEVLFKYKLCYFVLKGFQKRMNSHR